ncbi:MAG: AAA family ATPase, partial [Planctomycetota bacterium]
AVACALVGDPELLFLDEPTTGLDPQARRRLWEVVRAYLDGGGTVVLTTHYMEEAAQMCDSIAIVDRGRIIAEGTPNQLIASLGAEQVIEFGCEADLVEGELTGLDGVQHHERIDDRHVLRTPNAAATLPGLLSYLGERGIEITDLGTHRATLDDVFLHLTGKALRDG